MATRSTIGIDNGDGTITFIYCHFDGYPSHQMPILTEHYATKDKVLELISQGDLSYLAPKCDKPEGHTFREPVDGYCVYYHRDRGDNWDRCSPLTKLEKIAKRHGHEYNYVFKDETWSCFARAYS